MRTSFLRTLSVLCISGGAFVALATTRLHDAQAAWPPAAGADMHDKANWPNDFNARWNYISYFPERSTQTPLLAADTKLGASGMSVDKAWTYTVGSDNVKIAVIDSGIEWENPDLVNKVALNAAELKGDRRPQTAAGAECGGTGALAGYDCNGDGSFTVADYRDDPRFSGAVTGEPCFTDGDRKKPGADRIKGDVNRNCILDPGDLIAFPGFSDGVDDDANGYTDDIAGWDFFKNDNDPYDDTRFGHGTGEAEDSTAEANNGDGDPGICPGCRFIPLRIGDSFIGDANDFAKAVVYATDNGAKVVQEALGTLDQTLFSKAAIDYAYSKNVIVVASMADENSRHHNMPGTANHTLTVHTVRYNEQKPENSNTFIAYDMCSNYGGHLSMSISGTSCSSEATGRASGIAGLVYSMAEKKGLTLTAEEVMQLFKMNADDIDVAESRQPQPPYYYSHPGFDQRFGYGRANADRMMQAIDTGMIPPEVDVVSPEWFEPIHADRVSGPIAIMGRVSALRAKSYDFKVQWAPGVQPDEGDYKDLVAPLTNIPAATVSGGTTQLAQFDPRQIDTTHAQDPDSLHGENDRSISIRVHAVAHYDGGDVHGEARRVVAITNEKNGLDADLLPGFPMNLGASLEASVKLADIDGDGQRDIVVPDSSGRLHVFSMKGGKATEVAGFPYLTRPIDGINADLSTEPTVPSYLAAPAYKAGAQGGIDPAIAREAVMAPAAIADLNGDGKPELVLTTWPGSIYVIDSSGKDLPGWPKRLPLVPSCPLDTSKPMPASCMDTFHGFARGTYSAPVVVDLTKDGKPEIVISAFDGNLYAYKTDGSMLEGYPVVLKSPRSDRPSRIMATPTAVDLNGDGIPELVSGSNQQLGGGGGAGPVFAVDGRGNNAPGGPYLPNWPIAMTSIKLYPVIAEGVVASQAAADLDGDGVAEIVIQGNGAPPIAVKADPGPQVSFEEPPNRLPKRADDTGAETYGFQSMTVFGSQTKADTNDVMLPLFSQPSVGDMDQDGVPDIIVSGGSLTLAGSLAGGGQRAERSQQLIAIWSGKTGTMLPGAPIVVEDYTFLLNHAVADVSGDGYPEVITGTGGYFVHAADGCGNEAPGFPKFTNGWIASTAAVGDVDGDNGLEVVVGTREGYLFAWHTKGKSDGAIEWESFHHDNANTGNLLTKLDQGGGHAATALTCADPNAAGDGKLDAGGGCGCKTASSSSDSSALGLASAATLAALLIARRRRAARTAA